MDLSTWLTFLVATTALSLWPGPSALAAMGAGVRHGFRLGQGITYGLVLGAWTQMAIIGFGLGALMAAGQGVFAAVQWLGAAYLVWVGVQHWRAPLAGAGDPDAADETPGAGPGSPAAVSRRSLLLRGWTVNTVNPKGTVFLLALLPQFVVPDRPLLPQYLLIGSTFGVVEFCVMSGYVALASRLLGRMRSAAQQRWLNRSFGSLFIAAGLALAGLRRSA